MLQGMYMAALIAHDNFEGLLADMTVSMTGISGKDRAFKQARVARDELKALCRWAALMMLLLTITSDHTTLK